MINEGTFPKPVKVGKRALWPESHIQNWVKNLIASQLDGGEAPRDLSEQELAEQQA